MTTERYLNEDGWTVDCTHVLAGPGSSGEGVDVLDGNNIVPYKSTIHGQRLSCNDDFLWSCGGNSIYRFDGSGWLAESFG